MIGLEFILDLYKMSSTELAEKLDIAKQNISRWFSKERGIPKKYLPLLEELFKLPQNYFEKEISVLDELYIRKIKIENELNASYDEDGAMNLEIRNDIDLEKSYEYEEIESEISMVKIIDRMRNLYLDKDTLSDDIDHMNYIFELVLEIIENKNTKKIIFSDILYAISQYYSGRKDYKETITKENKFDLEPDKEFNMITVNFIEKIFDTIKARENEHEKLKKDKDAFWEIQHKMEGK